MVERQGLRGGGHSGGSRTRRKVVNRRKAHKAEVGVGDGGGSHGRAGKC